MSKIDGRIALLSKLPLKPIGAALSFCFILLLISRVILFYLLRIVSFQGASTSHEKRVAGFLRHANNTIGVVSVCLSIACEPSTNE